MSCESGPRRCQVAEITGVPQESHRGVMKARLTCGLSWGSGEMEEGDSKGQEKARRTDSCHWHGSSVGLKGGTQKPHPFALSLHAMGTEPLANLSSTHENSRTDGSLSHPAASVKHDSDLLRGPKGPGLGCTIPTRTVVPHTEDGLPKPGTRQRWS